MKFSKVLPLFIVASAVAASYADDTYSFKRTPKVGEIIKVRVRGDLQVMGQDAVFVALSTEKVTEVKSNGDYTMESTQSEGKVTFGGNEMETPNQGSVSTTFNAKGEILEIKSEKGADSSSYRLQNLGAFITPESPVKVGDSWKYSAKRDDKTGAEAFGVEYKILATEKIGTHDTVKLSMVCKETAGAEPASATGTVWVDAKDFSMVKSESVWANAPVPGAPGPVNGKFVSTRED